MRKLLKKILYKYNSLYSKPYGFDSTDIVLDFQSCLPAIILEWNNFQNLADNKAIPIDELSVAKKHLNQDKKWKAFFLLTYGETNQNVLSRFPEISKLIKKWSDEITLVIFSNMDPGKHIPANEDNNYGVLRMQFGIDIPEPEKKD